MFILQPISGKPREWHTLRRHKLSCIQRYLSCEGGFLIPMGQFSPVDREHLHQTRCNSAAVLVQLHRCGAARVDMALVESPRTEWVWVASTPLSLEVILSEQSWGTLAGLCRKVYTPITHIVPVLYIKRGRQPVGLSVWQLSQALNYLWRRNT